jgi:hypothetical protein
MEKQHTKGISIHMNFKYSDHCFKIKKWLKKNVKSTSKTFSIFTEMRKTKKKLENQSFQPSQWLLSAVV